MSIMQFSITTDATPEQVKPLFRRAYIIGRRFRLVHVHAGAEVLVDGRGVGAYTDSFDGEDISGGYYVGPTLLDKVTTDMSVYTDEIFGPVLSTVRAESYEEALKLAMDHEYGNGTAIFTRDGDAARDFASRCNIGMVGINTGLPNRLTEEAIAARMIGDLGSYETLRREQKYGQNSRIDLLLDDPARGRAYVEVKNVHLRRAPGLAEFPDTRTARGAKHLRELGDMAEEGHRAIMVFLIQRADCDSFRLCRDLDPDYAREFDRAIARGVEAFAVRCHISQAAIAPERLVAIDEAILRAAGFSDVTLFYAAFTWRGWVARA